MTSATDTSEPAPTRGRPRSEDRTEAILEATYDLLQETGYDNLRMQDVAERCGSGLATIYRRWATKPDLVADALVCKPMFEVEPTGDARRDLVSLIEALVTDIAGKRDFLPGMMTATRDHPQIRQAMTDQVASGMRKLLADLIHDMHGDITGAELMLDAIPGVLLLRAGMLHEDVDAAAYADEILAALDALAR